MVTTEVETLTSGIDIAVIKDYWYYSNVIETITPIQSIKLKAQQFIPLNCQIDWYATNNYGEFSDPIESENITLSDTDWHQIILIDGPDVENISKYFWDSSTKSLIGPPQSPRDNEIIVEDITPTTPYIAIEGTDFLIDFTLGKIKRLLTIEEGGQGHITSGDTIQVTFHLDLTNWENVSNIVNDSIHWYAFAQLDGSSIIEYKQLKHVYNQFALKARLRSNGPQVKVYNYEVDFDYFRTPNTPAFKGLHFIGRISSKIYISHTKTKWLTSKIHIKEPITRNIESKIDIIYGISGTVYGASPPE